MIRLLIVDDDPFIRESLKLILDLDDKIHVQGAATNGLAALEHMEHNGPVDVVLIDIRMPVCDGVEGTLQIKQRFPDTKVLILTTFDDDEYIVRALRNGANGYMLKNIPPDRIIEGIKTVAGGSLLIHPDIAKKLTGMLAPLQTEPAKPTVSLEAYGLTPNERTVVLKIAEGLSNKEIAQAMYLSEGTVKNHITEILGKLALRDRTQIAIFYLKLGHG